METELCKNMQTYSDSLVKATLMKISPIQYHQFWLAGQYVNKPFQEDDQKYCEAFGDSSQTIVQYPHHLGVLS